MPPRYSPFVCFVVVAGKGILVEEEKQDVPIERYEECAWLVRRALHSLSARVNEELCFFFSGGVNLCEQICPRGGTFARLSWNPNFPSTWYMILIDALYRLIFFLFKHIWGRGGERGRGRIANISNHLHVLLHGTSYDGYRSHICWMHGVCIVPKFQYAHCGGKSGRSALRECDNQDELLRCWNVVVSRTQYKHYSALRERFCGI